MIFAAMPDSWTKSQCGGKGNSQKPFRDTKTFSSSIKLKRSKERLAVKKETAAHELRSLRIGFAGRRLTRPFQKLLK